MSEALGAVAPLAISAAGDTHIGGREHNEDSVLLRPDLSLWAVADGAGGHNAGNVASALATTSAAHYFESTQDAAAHAPVFDEMGLPWAARRLATAFQRANQEVIEVADSSDRRRGMGSTLVAAHFDLARATLVLGHVGDSRCYRLRGGRLERLTQDHTLINDVLEIQPDIDPDRAAALPRNVITNALGMDERVRVSVRTFEVAPGDRYLLCSDGLTDAVDDGQLAQGLQISASADEAVRLLIDLAQEGGARDNIATVVMFASVAPGVGRLPVAPIPPRRHYRPNEDSEEVLVGEDEEETLLVIDGDDEAYEEPDLEVIVIEDPDDEDAPMIEIVRDRPASDAGRRRRPDDTVMNKRDR
ncbi:MAG: PP2C family serine/threonine-protein phosphatase [Sandaracinaceae bacterium]